MGAFAIVVVSAGLALCPFRAGATQQASAPRAPMRVEGPVADSLRAWAVQMGALLRARSVDAVIALYGDTAHFVHIDNGAIIPWSQLSPMMRTYLGSAAENPISVVGEPGVVLINRNTAVVYVMHHVDSTAGRPGHDGVWTGVLHRDRTGWKIVHSHSADRHPEPSNE